MKILDQIEEEGSSTISYAGLLEKIEILRSTLRWASKLERPEIEKLLRQSGALRDEVLQLSHKERFVKAAAAEPMRPFDPFHRAKANKAEKPTRQRARQVGSSTTAPRRGLLAKRLLEHPIDLVVDCIAALRGSLRGRCGRIGATLRLLGCRLRRRCSVRGIVDGSRQTALIRRNASDLLLQIVHLCLQRLEVCAPGRAHKR